MIHIDGAGYINNADRFHTDTAGEEREIRQEALLRKQKAYELSRQQVRTILFHCAILHFDILTILRYRRY